MFRKLESLFKLTIAQLYAVECLHCGTLLCTPTPLCKMCSEFSPLTPEENAAFRADFLDSVYSIFWLTEPALSVMHALKYQGATGFLSYLRSRSHPLICPRDPNETLIPVPLSTSSYLNRGFNPAKEIACWISHKTLLPMTENLVKVKETLSQSTLGREERQKNLKGAFDWQSSQPVPRKIVLVDDIFTTGATLGACAKYLRKLGAEEVSAITLFRTPMGFQATRN